MESYAIKNNKIEKTTVVTVEIDEIRNEIMMLENEKKMLTERIPQIDERIATLTILLKNIKG